MIQKKIVISRLEVFNKIMNVVTFSDVEVEEVTIQHSLHHTSYDGNQLIVILNHVAVDLQWNQNFC